MTDPLLRLRKVADDVRQILDEAKRNGSISLDQLDVLLPGEVTPDDMEELIKALEARGIVVDEGEDNEETQEASDASLLDSVRNWIASGNPMPQLTGEAWTQLGRAVEREKVSTERMKLRYFSWDLAPAVVSGDEAVFMDLNGSWIVGAAAAILRTEWRDAPEMSREELVTRFPDIDIGEAERKLATRP